MTAVEVETEKPRSMVKPWRLIEIGNSKWGRGISLVRAISASHCVVHRLAEVMICSESFTPSPVPRTVALRKLSLRDLGFREKRVVDLLQEVLPVAERRGLGPCPHSVAPEKCLQSTSGLIQKGQKLHVAMKPIGVGSVPLVFVLSVHESGWYRIGAASSRILMPWDELIFVSL